MASVHIENLSKSYGLNEVIHNVGFDINDGEFVILVGPSGCGKSTLLRMIAGLESITGGEIAIDGRVVNDLEPKDRDIAMVFQNYALYPQMTVAQNMGFALELARRSKAEIAEKVNAAAEVLGLEDLLDRKPAQLSGGQRQRVAMGRAIVRAPKVFLFDEPLSNLDAKLRVHMRGEIKSLHRRLGTTIIYVTHDQIEAMTMADRIVVLNAGRFEQAGAPLELYDRPANVFVAGFLGSPAMNLLTGRITGGDTSVLELDSGGTIETRPIDIALSGLRVTFGIRPEHLQIARTGGTEVQVESLEPTGSETHLATRLGTEEVVCVLKERLDTTEGATVRLSFASDQSHFFDAETGKRIDV